MGEQTTKLDPYQQLIRDMHQRVRDLEEQNARLRAALAFIRDGGEPELVSENFTTLTLG